MEEAAQGPQGWGFGFLLSWALPRSCPYSVYALRDAALAPGPVLTLLLLNPSKFLLCCAAASAIRLRPLRDRDVPWDNSWLGGLLLAAPLTQIHGQGWEGLS